MTILEALFLGVVQGLTEFFPISSSGHLALFENLFHFQNNSGIFFDVFLHLGTLTAVVIVLRKDIVRLIMETGRIFRDLYLNMRMCFQSAKTRQEPVYLRILTTNYRHFVVLILVASVPTGLLGALFSHLAAKAQQTLLYPGVGFLLTGILLIVSGMIETGDKIPKDIPVWQGVLVGVMQGVSVFPGISRSATTICGSLYCGMSRKLAVRFSFLLSVPAVIGALIFELATSTSSGTVTPSIVGSGLIGAVSAGVIGYFCVKKMLILVTRNKLSNFAYYCFVIGVIAIIGHFVTGEA